MERLLACDVDEPKHPVVEEVTAIHADRDRVTTAVHVERHFSTLEDRHLFRIEKMALINDKNPRNCQASLPSTWLRPGKSRLYGRGESDLLTRRGLRGGWIDARRGNVRTVHGPV